MSTGERFRTVIEALMAAGDGLLPDEGDPDDAAQTAWHHAYDAADALLDESDA